MKIVAICQARMASTRLPGKMLLPLAGAPLVQRVLERVRQSTKVHTVVLACPLSDYGTFQPIVSAMQHTAGALLSCYAGPHDDADLIARYYGAGCAYDADLIVRVPCDNPCVQPEYIDEAIEAYLSRGVMFYSNTMVLYPYGPVCVDGVGAEVFSMSRLKWLDQITNGNAELREHPHKYFYNHVDLGGGGVVIKCGNVTDGILRLDVNTQSDYEFIADIYDHCYPTNPHFTIKDILAYLETKTVPA